MAGDESEVWDAERFAQELATREKRVRELEAQVANIPQAPAAKQRRAPGDPITLLRRALVRIHVLEERVAALEERQHDLDDMAEMIRGLQRLAKASAFDEGRVRTIVNNTIDKRLAKLGKQQ